MRERGAVQVVNAIHPRCQFWGSEHPSAAYSAQSVCFGQAVGNDELFWVNVKRALWSHFKQHLTIDLIYQHISSNFARQSANLMQDRVRNQRSAWVMQVA